MLLNLTGKTYKEIFIEKFENLIKENQKNTEPELTYISIHDINTLKIMEEVLLKNNIESSMTDSNASIDTILINDVSLIKTMENILLDKGYCWSGNPENNGKLFTELGYSYIDKYYLLS